MNDGLIPRRYAKALYKFACEKGADKGLYSLMGNLVRNFVENPSLVDVVANPFVTDDKKIQLLTTAAEVHTTDTIAENPVEAAEDAGVTLPTVAEVATVAPEASDAKVMDVYEDFLKLLARNKRLAIARDAALAYRDIYRKQNRIYRVSIVSAQPLDPSEKERLKKLILSHLNGGKMECSFGLDPDLIGGFTVNIDNERLDASVKNELTQLRVKLLGQA